MHTEVHTEVVTYRHRRPASRLTIVAHVFGVFSFILMLVWLLHFRAGIEYHSYNPDRVLNVHPFLMFCGFIFLVGEAMMAFKTVPSTYPTQKYIHMGLHLVAICLGITGICAVFKYHDMVHAMDLYTLHSWIGLATFVLFGLQWIFGLLTFLLNKDPAKRARMLPWHVCGGRALFFMAICAALTGLMGLEDLQQGKESRLVNVLGLSILLFGIFVDLTVALARYV